MSSAFTRFCMAVASIALLCAAPRSWAQPSVADDAELVETRTEVPKLKAAAAYTPKDGVVEIELSEYAGYSGLIVANGGMEPNPNSIFTKKHGIKVKFTISEEESWSSLNSGRVAASATTADVLAVYGRQFSVVTPLLIGFSRGADGIVVRNDVRTINQLKGKVVTAAQFTETDFFIRYLAQEAGLKIKMLADPKDAVDPEKVNLLYCADGFGAGDIFLRDVKAGRNRFAGCVTWEPKTSEVAKGSGGKAHVLATNRNLLIIADLLVVNKGFADANPEIMKGLVAGALEGNDMVRTDATPHLATIGKAFGWTADEAKAELAKVHLANLPENTAFFSGQMDSAGSFNFIYETASYVYGKELIGNPVDPERFVATAGLKAADASGAFKAQKASIQPIRAAGVGEKTGNEELEALLSKDIRFSFVPNSSKLDIDVKENADGLKSIAQLVKISPGSRVLLRGHADGALLAQRRAQQGEAKYRESVLALKALSKARCAEVKEILTEKFGIESARIETQGVGADEPTGKGSDADRRVEVQWFTVE
jgi:NitT/TauT family transport system substrate-binding protein